MARKWIIGLVVVLCLAVGVLAYRYVKHEASLVVSRTCKGCTVAYEQMHLDWFKGRIFLDEVLLVIGKGTPLEIVAEIQSLSIQPKWRSLWMGRLSFVEIAAKQPKITLRERPKDREPSKETESSGLTDFEVAAFVVDQGIFVYEDLDDQRLARLSLSHIDLTVRDFKTQVADETASGTIQGEALGVLEGSGTFRLKVTTNPFLARPTATVTLHVENQDLKGVNPFFLPDSGVELEGTLEKGDTRVELKGDKLRAWATVVYRDLNVGLRSVGDDMGPLEATLGSLFADITLAPTSQRGDQGFASGEAEVTQRPGKSVVSFILNGMKEAAMAAAKKPIDPRPFRSPRSPGQ